MELPLWLSWTLGGVVIAVILAIVAWWLWAKYWKRYVYVTEHGIKVYHLEWDKGIEGLSVGHHAVTDALPQKHQVEAYIDNKIDKIVGQQLLTREQVLKSIKGCKVVWRVGHWRPNGGCYFLYEGPGKYNGMWLAGLHSGDLNLVAWSGSLRHTALFHELNHELVGDLLAADADKDHDGLDPNDPDDLVDKLWRIADG